MYILVNYTKDWGITEVGRYDTWRDAAREIAEGIRNVFEIEVDIDEMDGDAVESIRRQYLDEEIILDADDLV